MSIDTGTVFLVQQQERQKDKKEIERQKGRKTKKGTKGKKTEKEAQRYKKGLEEDAENIGFDFGRDDESVCGGRV